jgi:uncharacterized lipoprotein YmbA
LELPWQQQASFQQQALQLLVLSLQPLVDLLNGNKVCNRTNHTANRWAVFFDDDVANALEPEGAKCLAVIWLATNFTLNLGHL